MAAGRDKRRANFLGARRARSASHLIGVVDVDGLDFEPIFGYFRFSRKKLTMTWYASRASGRFDW